jgi:hypothetical protein
MLRCRLWEWDRFQKAKIETKIPFFSEKSNSEIFVEKNINLFTCVFALFISKLGNYCKIFVGMS